MENLRYKINSAWRLSIFLFFFLKYFNIYGIKSSFRKKSRLSLTEIKHYQFAQLNPNKLVHYYLKALRPTFDETVLAFFSKLNRFSLPLDY